MIPRAIGIRLRDRQKSADAWVLRIRVPVDVQSSSGDRCSVASAESNLAVALDTDRGALETVHGRSAPPHLLEPSAVDLPLRSACAHTVFLLDVAEHAAQEMKVFAAIRGILCDNAVLILSALRKGFFEFPDLQNLSARLRVLRIERFHFGGLLVYPAVFAPGNFFRKHLRLNWSNFFDLPCDRDNDVSWLSWSSNSLMLARKAPT